MEELDYLTNLGEIESDYLSTGARALADYISTLPQAKVIKESRMIESCRCFVIDARDYSHRVLVGITEKEDPIRRRGRGW